MSACQRNSEIQKAQLKRDEWEDAHLGGFEKLYPLKADENDVYKPLIQFAQRGYEDSTGVGIRKQYGGGAALYNLKRSQ